MFAKKFPNQIKSLFGRRSDRRRRMESRARPGRGGYSPLIEALEDRLVLSTLLVTDIADSAGSATDVTLRYAVNNAQNGDQIAFAGSLGGDTITLGSVLTISHGVTINGLGAANLAISGNNAVEVFSVNSGVTASISNLTIENGHVSGSGGISNSGTLTLTNDNISGNSAGGGGIFNNAGGILSLSNATLSGNSAGGGGAIVNGTGSQSNPATMTVSNSTISGNTQASGGGILNTYNSKMTLSSDTISGNMTNGSGGGIYNQAYMTVSNSTISGNQANNGGGIFDTGSVTASNSTIVGNYAASAGGGTNNYRGGASIVLINTILTGNTNYAGPNDEYEGYSGYNDLVGIATNLGALAGNGGLTQTVALQAGSNAIGAGQAVTSVSSDTGGSTITVANGAAIASTPGAYLIQSGSEQMLVTNVSGNTLTVVRGYNGTTVATHVGAGVFFDVDQRGYAINTSTPTPDIGAYQSQGTAPLAPTITSISPNSGPIAGGTAVTITGSNLSNATTVNFGPLPGTIVSDSGSVIVATTPALSAGTYDTTMTTVGWDTSATSAADQFATPATIADAPLTAGALTPPTGTGQETVSTFASNPSFHSPVGLAFDAAGNLYVVNDNYNGDNGSPPLSEVSSTGQVSTFGPAGGFNFPQPITSYAGNLYVASASNNDVEEVTPQGASSTYASGFNTPNGVAFDAAGNLYVSNDNGYQNGAGTVVEVTPQGRITLASGLTSPSGLAFDSAGNLYVADGGNNRVLELPATGGGTYKAPTTFGSGYSSPVGLAFDATGNLYVANANNGTVSEVTPQGAVSTYAAGLSVPTGLAFDAAGNLYVANTYPVNGLYNTTSKIAPPPLVDGQAFSNATVFHFTDADPNGKASDYTAVVALGDGNSVTLTSTPSANGQIVAAPNGGFDVQLSYIYSEALSNATFSVAVSDAGGSTTSASTSTFNVAKAASLTTVSDAGGTYDGTTAFAATDSVTGFGTITGTASLDYYDDTTSTDMGATTPVNAGSYTVTATYAGDANHDGSSASANFTVNEANATILVTPYGVTYDGNTHTATGTATGISGVNLSGGLDLSDTTHTASGTYNGDAWSFAGGTNYNDASGTVDDSIATATLVYLTQPSGIVAGHTMNPAVTVALENSSGHIITTYNSPVTMTFATGGGLGPFAPGSTVIVTAVNGVATFTNLSIDAAGGYLLQAYDTYVTSANSSPFIVTPAAASGLAVFQHPSNATAGVANSPAVIVDVVDQFGNLVTTDTSTVTIGVASGPTTVFDATSKLSVVASGGIATFSKLILDTAGSYSLSATDGTLTGAATNSFNVTAAAPSQLVFFSQPSNTIAGVAISPAVTVFVMDKFGNLATTNNSIVTISVPSGPTTTFDASSTLSVAATGGIATFSNLILDTAGSYRLKASDGALTIAISSSFSVSAAAATQLVFISQPTTAVHGHVIAKTPEVAVEDQYGNIVTTDNNSQVTISGNNLAGTSTTTVTVVNGIATFSNLTIMMAGATNLTATKPGLLSATSANINVT